MDPNHVLTFSKRLYSRLYAFFAEEKYCDVCIHVEGKQFKCHRLILILSSKYFETMFGSEHFVEHRNYDVTLQTDAIAFKEVIHFSYTGIVNLTEDNVFDVLQACDFFQIDNHAEEQCIVFMWQNLHSTTLLSRVFEILRFACSAKKPAVIEMAAAAIAKNISLLWNERQFLELTFDEFEIIVSQRWYMPRENERYFVEVFCLWLKHIHEKKSSHLRELIGANKSYKHYNISESNMTILTQVHKLYLWYRMIGLNRLNDQSFLNCFTADNIHCVELTSEILLSLVYLFFFLDPENVELFPSYFQDWGSKIIVTPQSRHHHHQWSEKCWSITLAQAIERLKTVTIEEPTFVTNSGLQRLVINPPATGIQKPCVRGLHVYTRTVYTNTNAKVKWLVHSVKKDTSCWQVPDRPFNYKYLRAGGVAVGADLFWLRFNNNGTHGAFERRPTFDVFSAILEVQRKLEFPPCCSYLRNEHRKSFNMCNVYNDIYLNIVSNPSITPGRSCQPSPDFTDEDIARALHRYNIACNKWYSVPPLNEVRETQSSICAYGCVLCLIENTKDASNPILRIQMLDSRMPVWLKFIASPPLEPGYYHSTSCVHDGRIYVCADDDGSNSQIRVFDVRASRWDSSEDHILRRAYRIDSVVSYENVLWAIGKSENSIQVETFNSSIRRWSRSPVVGTIGVESMPHALIMDSIVYNY